MADLIELGLLEQPHTSAGRVPSQKGYREYVDRLMEVPPVKEEERRVFDSMLLSGSYEPEQLVGKTLVAIVNLPPRKMMGIDSCGMIISAVHQEAGEERLNLLILDDAIPAGAKLY